MLLFYFNHFLFALQENKTKPKKIDLSIFIYNHPIIFLMFELYKKVKTITKNRDK